MSGIIFKIGMNFFVPPSNPDFWSNSPQILRGSPDAHQAAPQGRSYLGCLFGHRCQGSNETARWSHLALERILYPSPKSIQMAPLRKTLGGAF